MKFFNQALLFTALAILGTSCGSESSARKEESPLRVEVYQPVLSAQEGISVSGVVSAKQSAVLSTRMMAFVDRIPVKQGDKVKAGQLLIRLNGSELKAKRAQAQAQFTEAEAAAKNAQKDYERFRRLHAQESVSDKELENMELNQTSMLAKLEMTRQGLKEVDALLAYTDIKAPFTGIVSQKMIEEGNMANPGMPLMVIEQPGKMEVKASVPENYVHRTRVGDAVKVEIKSLNCMLDGRISELSSSAAMTGGQYTMKVDVDLQERNDVRSGMFAAVRLIDKEDRTLCLLKFLLHLLSSPAHILAHQITTPHLDQFPFG